MVANDDLRFRFLVGDTWFVLVFTGALRKIIALTPMFIVRGIQLALGLLLAWEGFKLMRPNLLLGLAAIIIVVILRDNRHAPAALVLMGLGVAIVCWNGDIRRAFEISFTLPPLTLPRLHDVSSTMILAGLADSFVNYECGDRHSGLNSRLLSR